MRFHCSVMSAATAVAVMVCSHSSHAESSLVNAFTTAAGDRARLYAGVNPTPTQPIVDRIQGAEATIDTYHRQTALGQSGNVAACRTARAEIGQIFDEVSTRYSSSISSYLIATTARAILSNKPCWPMLRRPPSSNDDVIEFRKPSGSDAAALN